MGTLAALLAAIGILGYFSSRVKGLTSGDTYATFVVFHPSGLAPSNVHILGTNADESVKSLVAMGCSVQQVGENVFVDKAMLEGVFQRFSSKQSVIAYAARYRDKKIVAVLKRGSEYEQIPEDIGLKRVEL